MFLWVSFGFVFLFHAESLHCFPPYAFVPASWGLWLEAAGPAGLWVLPLKNAELGALRLVGD